MASPSRVINIIMLCLSVASPADAQRRQRGKEQAGDKPATVKKFPDDALNVALKTAAQSATQAKQKRVLVIVRDDSRNLTKIDRAELLTACRQRVLDQLRSLKLDAVESAEVEKLAMLTRPLGAMRTTDVRIFQRFAKFDAVLDVVVKQRGPVNRLSLSLLTDKTKLWSGVAKAPALQQKNTAGAQAGAKQPGRANGNPLANVPLLNRRILQYALSQLGRKVGNGECWTLAATALVQSGARRANNFNFGQQIPLAKIQPGDILQFKSARFDMGNSYYLFGAPDHTVIVLGVEGSKVSILHQNFGKKIVSTLTIDFKNMTKGKVWAWRPVPR